MDMWVYRQIDNIIFGTEQGWADFQQEETADDTQ